MRNPRIQFIIRVLLPISLGSIIYLFFRNKADLHIEAFLPSDLATLEFDAPDWIKYNLPDGLWLFSGLNLIDLIWQKQPAREGLFYALMLIGIALGSECLQFSGLLLGTADIYDVSAYVIAIILFISTKTRPFRISPLFNIKTI